MKKGVLGIGCSYTWGEGLYYYSDLENLPFRPLHEFNPSEVTPAMMLFKDNHKFIKLVADYLNTWGWTNRGNGGTNESAIKFYLEDEFVNKDLFKINDFQLIIFQFTHVSRSISDGIDMETQIKMVDEKLKEFENNGVKVITFCWDEEIPNSTLYKKLFKNRHIDITIDGETKPGFDYFVWNNKFNITIASDFEKKGYQKNDLHFNLRGHEIIADLIIDKLKK
jgi:hypothetical protein